MMVYTGRVCANYGLCKGNWLNRESSVVRLNGKLSIMNFDDQMPDYFRLIKLVTVNVADIESNRCLH